MQTLGPFQQRGSQHAASASPPTSTPPTAPAFQLPSLFGSPTKTLRQTRRPGTSSGSAAVDRLLGPAPLGNGAPFSDQASFSRRAFTFGLGGVDATSFRLKKSPLRKPSLGDLPSHYTWKQQQQQQQPSHSPPALSRFKGLGRRANSSSNLRDEFGTAASIGKPYTPGVPFIDTGNPPALPLEYALSSPRKPSTSGSSSRDHNPTSPGPSSRTPSASMDSGWMGSRQGTMSSNNGSLSATGGLSAAVMSGGIMQPPSTMGMQTESTMVHQHIQEMANKRISTLEYLRKAHEGRVYWFNTLLFDKPDLARMPYFDTRRLARRATNYLLLGLSLPTVIDLNTTSPLEFLRSLNLLLTEFDTFQSLHPEAGSSGSALGRARIPNLNVFRRGASSAKGRRSSSATTDVLYEDGEAPAVSNGGGGGGGGGGSGTISSIPGSGTSVMNGLGGSASVVSFGQSEADLLPGEEYVHLLTPSLPFDPDFFETFATLCDVLIDAYTRLLGMLLTPRECNAAVAESFTKADARVRKIIVQGIVKEFEDTSRNGVRTEVANVGKIVLGGLM